MRRDYGSEGFRFGALLFLVACVVAGMFLYSHAHKETQKRLSAEITARYGATVDPDQISALPVNYGQTSNHITLTVHGTPLPCDVQRSRPTGVLAFCGTGGVELPVIAH